MNNLSSLTLKIWKIFQHSKLHMHEIHQSKMWKIINEWNKIAWCPQILGSNHGPQKSMWIKASGHEVCLTLALIMCSSYCFPITQLPHNLFDHGIYGIILTSWCWSMNLSCYVDLNVLINNMKIKVLHEIVPCRSKFDKYIKCQLSLGKINYWFLTSSKY